MINWTRSGVAAVLGATSGYIDSQSSMKPFSIAGQTIAMGAAVELAALVAAGAVQFLSPMTMPDIVDGALDGALALVSHRVVSNSMSTPSRNALAYNYPNQYAGQMGGYMGSPMATPLGAYRPSIGGLDTSDSVRKVTLS